MGKLPPKAFYKLRIANRMRNVKYNLIAVEECIQKYLSIHYAGANSKAVSNSFRQISTILDGIMGSLRVDFCYGAPNNDTYTPIRIDRTAKSYFKMPIAGTIRDIKSYISEAKEFIVEYLTDNEIDGKDKIKDSLSSIVNLIDKIMYTIDLDENYGSPCVFGASFEYDKENTEEEHGEECEYDYDNNNEDVDVLKAYCNEVFTLNNCTDKNYSTLIDKSFENGMADAIPVALNDIAKIRKNILIWIDQYDYEDAENDADALTCDLFITDLKIEKELHLDRYMDGDKDTYLPISSLLKLWYIIKDCQYYCLHRK